MIRASVVHTALGCEAKTKIKTQKETVTPILGNPNVACVHACTLHMQMQSHSRQHIARDLHDMIHLKMGECVDAHRLRLCAPHGIRAIRIRAIRAIRANPC